jgi:hypothetical protein
MIQLALEQFAQILFSIELSALDPWQYSVTVFFSVVLVWGFLSGLWRLFKKLFGLKGWL